MDNFFRHLFKQREAAPGVPQSTMDGVRDADRDKATPPTGGGNYQERVVYAGSPSAALTVSAVYRAVELRAKTIAQMDMQYQKRSFDTGGNFVPDLLGVGKRINYLWAVQPNPVMDAVSLKEQIVIRRLQEGNAFVYVERDEFGLPLNLWLAHRAGFNLATGQYTLVYLGEHGPVTVTNTERKNVLHFPNTFRQENGVWGIPTLKYAIDTLTYIKTAKQQSLENAAKGGRVKLIIGEEKPASTGGTLAWGLMNKGEMDKYAQELQQKMYGGQDIVAMRGLDKIQNISMTAADMQMVENLGMSLDDVARFWATPRSLLMMDGNSHYSTYTNATMEYLSRTIGPDSLEIETEVNRKLLDFRDYGVRRYHFCDLPLLRMDKEAQAKIDQLRIQCGTLTVNEARQQYDMPAVEGGDRVWRSANLKGILEDGGEPTAEPGQSGNAGNSGEEGKEGDDAV